MSDNLHPGTLHGKPGVVMGGTNQGRVDVPRAGVGTDQMEGQNSGPGKGKARVGMGTPVKLAVDPENEGGYRR